VTYNKKASDDGSLAKWLHIERLFLIDKEGIVITQMK